MPKSILEDVKKSLGLAPDYTAFDFDIIMHTNSALSTLSQLGIGPDEGFVIEDETALWTEFLGDEKRYAAAKSYVYLQVRMLFDPPQIGFVLTAFKEQLETLLNRVSIAREEIVHPPSETDDEDEDINRLLAIELFEGRPI